MVMETYYRKRSKKAHQSSMELDQCRQKEAVQLQGSVAAAAPPQQSPPSGCCALLLQESQFLIPNGGDEDESQMQNHIKEGFLYEINHARLPPRTPAQLRSIRVAMLVIYG
ncbi:uncharacterized protein LOC130998246 [Salvia miltiorrhiza]|uniref:uncharacterized protein LOC130998246 n=1 Tax=Salvia miltiorrhiza TaxID=226208 RepID=UPI0025ACE9A9|nr:uncharacterized protein LOC130998246 [Salvia miltiorrhiza]